MSATVTLRDGPCPVLEHPESVLLCSSMGGQLWLSESLSGWWSKSCLPWTPVSWNSREQHHSLFFMAELQLLEDSSSVITWSFTLQAKHSGLLQLFLRWPGAHPSHHLGIFFYISVSQTLLIITQRKKSISCIISIHIHTCKWMYMHETSFIK